jgi:hypothetical protein
MLTQMMTPALDIEDSRNHAEKRKSQIFTSQKTQEERCLFSFTGLFTPTSEVVYPFLR